MLTMRVLLSLALLAAAVLALGCGGDSDESKIEDVLRSYIDAYVDLQPAEMYALLDSQSQARCTEDDFAAFIGRAREALGEREFEVVEVQDIVVNGDTATARVQSSVDGEATDPTENALLKEDGVWKLELPSQGC